jgi:Spy/CpxP family protein refolding chaperone
MRIFSKVISSVAVLGFTLLTAGSALSDERSGGFLERIKSQLDLSTEQREQLKAIAEPHRENRKAMHEELETARNGLEAALSSSATDQELRTLFETLKAAQEKMALARFEKILKIRAILTAEQRKKFREMLREHEGERRPRWGKEHARR